MKQLIISFLLSYLRFFARLAISLQKPVIIGIAGTAGKSSTRNAVFAILKKHYPTRVVAGNSETGIPLGILGISLHSLGFTTLFKSIFDWSRILLLTPFSAFSLHGTKYLIVEMGIDEPDPPKNMEYLLTIVQPDIAVELNVSVHGEAPVHSMQFEKLLKGKQVENKTEFLINKMAEEDTKIITKSGARVGIYNADDPYVVKQMQAYRIEQPLAHLLSFGQDKKNTISYAEYRISLEGTMFSFITTKAMPDSRINLHFPQVLLPKEYQEVFGAAVLIGLQAKLTLKQIKEALEEGFSVPKGRANMFEGVNDSVIIDSSYNASPASVAAFLEMVKELKKETKRPVVFLFGDMRELGNNAEVEHKRIAEILVPIVDELYLVGQLTKEYVMPLVRLKLKSQSSKLKKVEWFASNHAAGKYLPEHMPKGAIVLVKGSQNTIFLEEAIKYLLKNKADQAKLCRQEEQWMRVKG